ncbi:methyltransferase-like protein 25 [Heracleum sosnowskyi]|uniref:Methyltransferase-like protein 25 n=1 Tax=Heracleum sosnowskyi TaxID=360622 RepID=A0AAD8IYH5_9APIA|nr:methyltransferase-like protein 25 [Heracleum sosnowskyi]
MSGVYSCRSATETLEWIEAIKNFIKPYSFFYEAHVVNFFKDRLWEAVDKEWMDCLRNEPVENLLLIPSGVVQDHWPASLKDFITTLRSLALPREQADLKKVLPDLDIKYLDKVITQGMNRKKQHEVEVLGSIVSSIAKTVGVNSVLDVGAGQGYLAQVLSFQYQLSVIAIDACSHHGSITSARAERIKKHYAAKLHKSRSEDRGFNVPKTITCRVLSTGTLKDLSSSLIGSDDAEKSNSQISFEVFSQGLSDENVTSPSDADGSLILAGLHACGDLSVTMLRTFLECKEVKAVISIGCCYNLLSEDKVQIGDELGFPMSKGVRSSGLLLGKSARDLACQSAERWGSLGKDAGLQNFELHAFRAAFQMVLLQYYPEILVTSPAVGRQGKALRRQQNRRALDSETEVTLSEKQKGPEADLTDVMIQNTSLEPLAEKNTYADNYVIFEKFSQSALGRLGLHGWKEIDLAGSWKKSESFAELVGPYWSLRAALGPVLETILLLDRLLFLQEQGNSLEVLMLPIFDPTLSPRNVAFISWKI